MANTADRRAPFSPSSRRAEADLDNQAARDYALLHAQFLSSTGVHCACVRCQPFLISFAPLAIGSVDGKEHNQQDDVSACVALDGFDEGVYDPPRPQHRLLCGHSA